MQSTVPEAKRYYYTMQSGGTGLQHFSQGKNMLKYRNIVTINPLFHLLNEIESIDIDTEFDFMVAEIVYKKII